MTASNKNASDSTGHGAPKDPWEFQRICVHKGYPHFFCCSFSYSPIYARLVSTHYVAKDDSELLITTSPSPVTEMTGMHSLGVSVATINTIAKGNLWRKGFFFSLYLQVTVHHWRNPRKESGGRNWSRGHGAVLLPGLLYMACLACFLIQLMTAAEVWYPPKWATPNHTNH